MARFVEGAPACEVASGECRACFTAGERERAALECLPILLDAVRAIPVDPDAERIAPARRARNDDGIRRLAPTLRSAEPDALRHSRIMSPGVSAGTLLSVTAGGWGWPLVFVEVASVSGVGQCHRRRWA